jgi:endonuclease/exonuclease/phosphatase family metal-dependent hydrolase
MSLSTVRPARPRPSGAATRTDRRSAVLALLLMLAALFAGPASARDLRVATWNLGWHLDTALARTWIQACGQRFARSGADPVWRPSADGVKTGWELRWGRHAPVEWSIAQLPPCDVYQARFRAVPVTANAYAVRQRQIREILARDVDADVLAFQEVSGREAVREILPDGGAGHQVCSYEGHKVQRLAIAWRTSIGQRVSCEPHWPLSLPAREARDQPRPGLALTLRIDGRLLRVLTVHLKSSCVSPLEAQARQGRGQLDGDDPNCRVLQEQIAPLEAWIEQQSQGVDALVLLGDFNRNVSHESREPRGAAVRSRGSATEPHGAGVRVRNLWREVNDGAPATSALTLLESECSGEAARDLCALARERPLEKQELSRLSDVRGLGCRNPTGLAHIAVTRGLRAGRVEKLALGVRGRTAAATDERPDPLLAVSDHCPAVAELAWVGR